MMSTIWELAWAINNALQHYVTQQLPYRNYITQHIYPIHSIKLDFYTTTTNQFWFPIPGQDLLSMKPSYEVTMQIPSYLDHRKLY